MKSYDELTFADDFMFCKVMENEKICKGVIESLLGIKVGHVEKHVSQYSKKVSPESHGIRFDVYLEDSDRVFDIEMQTTSYKAIEKRIRYYQSVIDVDHLAVNADYSRLPESYILFICTFDQFSAGEPVYTVRKIVEENVGLKYNDGAHVMLFNASAYEKAEKPLLRDFLKFVYTTKSETELTDEIEGCVLEAKGNEKWRTEYMTLEMKIREEKEISYEQGHAAGLEQGIEQGIIQTALRMLKNGFEVKDVTLCTGISEEEVLKLVNN